MVITKLNGGLGNQLFQYAMGLATARRRQTSLKVDISEYTGGLRTRIKSSLGITRQGSPQRAYALEKWNVDAPVASLAEIQAIRIYHRIVRAAKPNTPYFAQPVVHQQSPVFDAELLRAPRTCLLIGFWQSEKFFANIESSLRLQFTPKFPLSPHAEAMAAAIQSNPQSTFLHIRRGDYISHENFQVCSLAYYQNAISYLQQHVSHPHFFVFSDDPEWACQHLATNEQFTLVTRRDLPNHTSTGHEHEDLWLMGLCQHGILSNSSFSWWGAWLNPSKAGIVVAPSLWQLKPDYASTVFIPDRWKQIDVQVCS